MGFATEWGTPIGRGGEAYLMSGYTYGKRKYAIKRHIIPEPLCEDTVNTERIVEKYQNYLHKVIKECCITKLCGILQIGPYPVQPMGFDIITYSNCIDFCMEYCLEIK